jgi:predicted small secreted protein
MNVTNLSSAAGAFMGGEPMNAVSGASSFVPAASSTTDSALTQMRSEIKQNSQDFKALKSALNASDLAGATQAFATLQQDIQKASSSAGGKSPFDPNSPIGKDFQALGNALQSGDISAAKQAFATFKQDIKSAGHAARAQHAQATSGTNDGDADDGGSSPGSTATTTQTAGGLLNTVA